MKELQILKTLCIINYNYKRQSVIVGWYQKTFRKAEYFLCVFYIKEKFQKSSKLIDAP